MSFTEIFTFGLCIFPRRWTRRQRRRRRRSRRRSPSQSWNRTANQRSRAMEPDNSPLLSQVAPILPFLATTDSAGLVSPMYSLLRLFPNSLRSRKGNSRSNPSHARRLEITRSQDGSRRPHPPRMYRRGPRSCRSRQDARTLRQSVAMDDQRLR